VGNEMKVKKLISILQMMPQDADVEIKVYEDACIFDEDARENIYFRSWETRGLDLEDISFESRKYEERVVYLG
jgi:hypothetical protein